MGKDNTFHFTTENIIFAGKNYKKQATW